MKLLYKELNVNIGRGITAKEVEKFEKVEECRKKDRRLIKIIVTP